MDPQNATAHRGLGFLYEQNEARAEAVEHFHKYLELAPSARDARQIKIHLETLAPPSSDKAPAESPVAETAAQH